MLKVSLDVKIPIDLLDLHEKRLAAAQVQVDSDVLRYSDPYIPFRDGNAKNSGMLNTEIGSGQVVWKTDYIEFIWRGKLMLGENTHSPFAKKDERKYLTDIDLNFSDAPMRGAKWALRMADDKMPDIVENAKRAYIGVKI